MSTRRGLRPVCQQQRLRQLPSRTLSPLSFTAVTVALLCGCGVALLCSVVSAASVEETRLMAVDMGAEWIKTATLDFTSTPDRPPSAAVNILLNDQANRKSPPCVAFRCSPGRQAGAAAETAAAAQEVVCERSFAEEALSLAPRFPTQVVCGPALLLGYTTEEALHAAVAAAGGEMPEQALRHTMSLPAGAAADHFLYHVGVDGKRDGFEVWIPSSSVGTRKEDYLTYTPEELTAMLLGQLTETVRKQDAERNGLPRHAFLDEYDDDGGDGVHGKDVPSANPQAGSRGPRVRHAALTVPSFSTVAERQALLDAGEISGLRVVRLVHSVTAAATALAYYREEQLFPPAAAANSNAAPSYVMIFDMGSRQTEAAVFALTPYSVPVPADGVRLGASDGRQRRGTIGRINLLAMSTNRTLGGNAFDRCIADYWDRTFLDGRVFARLSVANATREEEREAGKQRAALLRAANRARERLSANREAPVTVEGVAAGNNGGVFTTTLSRDLFERVCGDLFAAAVRVRDDAVAATHGAVSSVSQLARFEVVGGASRMPRLLELVSKGYGSGLVDRTLNGDEAVAVGAAYLGATAAGMLPRKFIVREALTNDIGAFLITSPSSEEEEREDGVAALQPAAAPTVIPVRGSANESGDDGGSHGTATAVLFPAHKTQLPATKSVVLTNQTDDFVFTLASPPELAQLVLEQLTKKGKGAEVLGATPAVCPGCYLQHNAIGGIKRALSRAALIEQTQSKDNVTVTVDATDVVLETSVSANGLPYLRKVYLRAHFTRAETAKAQETVADDDAQGEPPATEENDANRTSSEEPKDGAFASKPNGLHHDESDEEEAVTAPGEVENNATAGEKFESGAAKVSRFIRVFGLSAHVIDAGNADTKAETADVAQQRMASLRSYLPRGLNLRPADIAQSRATLRRLQHTDDYRYACSHLRNAMEAHLISLRLLDAYDAERGDITVDMLAKAGIPAREGCGNSKDGEQAKCTDDASLTEDLLHWREVVKELSDWLDMEGESATRRELAMRNARVEQLKSGVTRVLAL